MASTPDELPVQRPLKQPSSPLSYALALWSYAVETVQSELPAWMAWKALDTLFYVLMAWLSLRIPAVGKLIEALGWLA